MNKVIVVTGPGAGVGLVTTREFTRNGSDFALPSRDLDRFALCRRSQITST